MEIVSYISTTKASLMVYYDLYNRFSDKEMPFYTSHQRVLTTEARSMY